MIKLKFLQITAANLLLDKCETIEVKSVSAAWKHLREVRDYNISKNFTSALKGLEVKVYGLKEGDKIPEHIIFVQNSTGKIIFANKSCRKN